MTSAIPINKDLLKKLILFRLDNCCIGTDNIPIQNKCDDCKNVELLYELEYNQEEEYIKDTCKFCTEYTSTIPVTVKYDNKAQSVPCCKPCFDNIF